MLKHSTFSNSWQRIRYWFRTNGDGIKRTLEDLEHKSVAETIQQLKDKGADIRRRLYISRSD